MEKRSLKVSRQKRLNKYATKSDGQDHIIDKTGKGNSCNISRDGKNHSLSCPLCSSHHDLDECRSFIEKEYQRMKKILGRAKGILWLMRENLNITHSS